MPAIQSKLDTNSAVFQGNRKRMLELVAFLRGLEERTRNKSEDAKPLFDKRGQLLPRERIARLLDAGAPWLELARSEEHTSELQSLTNLVCRLLLEKKKKTIKTANILEIMIRHDVT